MGRDSVEKAYIKRSRDRVNWQGVLAGCIGRIYHLVFEMSLGLCVCTNLGTIWLERGNIHITTHTSRYPYCMYRMMSKISNQDGYKRNGTDLAGWRWTERYRIKGRGGEDLPPHISSLAFILQSLHDLWGHVRRSTAKYFQFLPRLTDSREAEID